MSALVPLLAFYFDLFIIFLPWIFFCSFLFFKILASRFKSWKNPIQTFDDSSTTTTNTISHEEDHLSGYHDDINPTLSWRLLSSILVPVAFLHLFCSNIHNQLMETLAFHQWVFFEFILPLLSTQVSCIFYFRPITIQRKDNKGNKTEVLYFICNIRISVFTACMLCWLIVEGNIGFLDDIYNGI